MRALRQRLRPDNIPNEERAARGSTGRIVYLVLLGIFTLAIVNFFVGDYFLFRADGLVLRRQSVVATSYIARVDSIDVRQGQAVEQGRQLLKLQSMEILGRLADLSMKRAELVAKATDFKIRVATSTLLLPLAERRENEAGNRNEAVRLNQQGIDPSVSVRGSLASGLQCAARPRKRDGRKPRVERRDGGRGGRAGRRQYHVRRM